MSTKPTADERKDRALEKKRDAALKKFDREHKKAYSDKHSLNHGFIKFNYLFKDYERQIVEDKIFVSDGGAKYEFGEISDGLDYPMIEINSSVF
jgi:hypothetical protein